MHRGAYVESEEGSRIVLPQLAPNQYAIAKVEMPGKVRRHFKHQTGLFLPGDDFYVLLTGFSLRSDIAERLVEKAKKDSEVFSVVDDLDQTGYLTPDSPHYHPFRLAHALEHLAVYDIIRRNVSTIDRRDFPNLKMGEARVCSSSSLFSGRKLRIGFHFNGMFVSSDEAGRSIRNANTEASSIYTH